MEGRKPKLAIRRSPSYLLLLNLTLVTTPLVLNREAHLPLNFIKKEQHTLEYEN